MGGGYFSFAISAMHDIVLNCQGSGSSHWKLSGSSMLNTCEDLDPYMKVTWNVPLEAYRLCVWLASVSHTGVGLIP